MQHSGEELFYNGQRERVGGGRGRKKEISRQFYLTDSFTRAHSRDRRKTQVRPLLYRHTETEIQTHVNKSRGWYWKTATLERVRSTSSLSLLEGGNLQWTT